jgi:PPK2 family polyphosphate:nucleotide phosphotransferase
MAKRKSLLEQLVEPYVIRRGGTFRLKDIDPDDTGGLTGGKAKAGELLEEGLARLHVLQEKLYADNRWGILLIFQGMDASGKDGAIKHVMSGVNPQGCQVHSFKQPSTEELDHDFMWRCVRRLPERGRIGIFNRSYYEDVLVVRVHERLQQAQRLPRQLVTRRIWNERYEDIAAFERYFARQGYAIRKFFLHMSPKEQHQRMRRRLDDPEKNWKFSLGDLKERARWADYMTAYEEAVRHTATPHAPWVVVPADKKWFARLVVAGAIVEAMEALDLSFPRIDAAKQRELAEGRRMLATPEPNAQRRKPKARA